MGIVRTGESEFDKEMAKWDTPRRMGGYGPDGYEAFPMMLSKAQKKANGQYAVHEMPPMRWLYAPGQIGDAQWDQAVLMAEEFTRRCQRTVRNQQEYERALADGWVVGQEQALAAAESYERAIADAAAHRAWEDRNLSEPAQREVAAVEAETHEHVAEVPRKRGRPKKADHAAA